MKCSKCGLENRDEAQVEAKYCRRCGTELMSKSSMIQKDNIIGRDEIIDRLERFINGLINEKRREKAGYDPDMENKLILFTGEPGTGKSTVVEWFIEELKAKENLITDNPCKIDAKQLKQNYADEFLLLNFLHKSSKLLIIDNIHDEIDYSAEIFRAVSSTKLGKIVICIGLKKTIDEFLDKNVDIRQKIYDIPLIFKDYTSSELTNILKEKVKEKGYSFSKEIDDDFLSDFITECNNAQNKKHVNGWLIEKEVWIKIYEAFSTRKDKLDLQTILPEDIPIKNRKRSEEEIFEELNALVGLDDIKVQIRQLWLSVKTTLERRKKGIPATLPKIHIVFNGNPGTGKTTVAKILGMLFCSIGLIPSDKVIKPDRADLVGEYLGQTAPKVNKQCDIAMGGILFIDEAYRLKEDDKDSFGQEAIDTLLTRMEDDRGKFIVIVAGYTDKMNRFLHSNPGLASRFNTAFDFTDYKPDDLYKIYKKIAREDHFDFTDAALLKASVEIKKLYARREKDFGNARTIRNMWETTAQSFSTRYQNLPPEKKTEEALKTIEAEDIPENFKEVA